MRIKGFTLIELIVVIAIIAILAAIIAPNAFKAVEKAKISGTVEDFKSIKTGAMAYYSDIGDWPANCTGSTGSDPCTSGFVTNDGASAWDGPYLEKWPAQSKWNGNYSFTNDPAGDSWNGTAAGERSVTITNIPANAAKKIDIAIDGAEDANHGDVRYGSGTGVQSVGIIISRDGSVD